VFLVFESASDPRFAGWASFRDAIDAGHVVSGPPLPARETRPGGTGIWRLVAPNNRELGRSWSAYPTFDEAHEHVVRLQRDISVLTVTGVRGPTSSQYGWVASLGERRVITSGRWFGASSTSLQSAATTLAAFCSAEIAAEPVLAAMPARAISRSRG
jgi:hypothetical protein